MIDFATTSARRAIALGLLLAGSGAAHAQTQTTTAGTGSDTIVVTATRVPQPVDQVGQAVTVIDRATLETRQTIAVSDLLATTPGVSVTRNGGIGAVTGVSLRGAEADQTLVLIDGVRVNDPSSPGAGFDFGNLLAGNIDRIEVLRGSNSVAWGSQALGGVVNIVTATPGESATVSAAGEYGYSDTVNLHGQAGYRLGPVALSGGGAFYDSDGISAFDRRLGGTERDGYRNLTLNARALVTLSDALNLDLRGYHIHGQLGIDGFPPPDYNFGDTRERSTSSQWMGYAGANLALLEGRWRNRLAFTYFSNDRTSIDPDGFVRETFDGTGRDRRIEYQGSVTIDPTLELTAGYEHDAARLSTQSFGGPVASAAARTDSGYALLIAHPIAPLTVTGGVRHDEHSRFGGATTLGANAALALFDDRTVLRASYGEAFKAPTLYQLFGDYGNRGLDPERARSFEVGVEQKLAGDRLRLAVTAFERRTRDQINFVSCFGSTIAACTDPDDPRPFGTYDNVARTRTRGVESSLELRPTDRLTMVAAYTYLDARNRVRDSANFGNRLARRPAHQGSVAVDWRSPLGVAVGATARIVGDSFDDAGNAIDVDGFETLDLRASLPLTAWLEVYGRVENVTDAHYERIFQYGTYGRSAYGGVRLRF